MADWMRRWGSSSWLDSVQTWINRVCEAYQVEQTGRLERVDTTLGSTVLALTTQAGDLYFKAGAPTRQHEARLVATAAPFSGGRIQAPLAIESQRGWMLTPGAGIPLSHSTDRTPGMWRRALSEAAQLQLELSEHKETLSEFADGMLPTDVPYYLEDALALHASLPKDHPFHVSETDVEWLTSKAEVVTAAAAVLTESSLPMTLVQGNLGASQIIVPWSHRAPLVFLGWGGASIGHPFGILGPVLDELTEGFGAEIDEEPVLSALNDYLDVWAAFGSREELLDLVGPAILLANAQRHRYLMDLLRDADLKDQTAAAPEVMRVLAAACAVPMAGGQRVDESGTAKAPSGRRAAGRRAAR